MCLIVADALSLFPDDLHRKRSRGLTGCLDEEQPCMARQRTGDGSQPRLKPLNAGAHDGISGTSL
jgi:hypothetical protein